MGAKEKGNAFFKEGKFPEAVEQYTEAIKRGPPKANPECHKLYSNRAACYTKLTAMNEAKKDAEKCIELEPKWAKGYSRKATVQFFMKEYDKAMEAYKQGLEQDPESQELQDFQENPKAAQEHLKAPTVMAKIQKLVNAGIV